jgi:hypothetical protein
VLPPASARPAREFVAHGWDLALSWLDVATECEAHGVSPWLLRLETALCRLCAGRAAEIRPHRRVDQLRGLVPLHSLQV